ncbi:ABC transporter substrate-binding protein [Aquabacter sp. CN5-332]|uniref:ABC transporter substrate-binding protein n=1 Tax=Aquabacter sp. CN5-332 TaxID=3156608 RepID=UPI0032B4F915
MTANVSRLFLALLLVFGSLSGAHAQQLEKIKVTIPVAAIIFFPLFNGQANGFFAKEGLDVEVISTNGDGPDVDALISGSVQFTVSTPNRLFMAAEQGKPLLAIANMAQRMNIDCAMNKATAEKLGITAETPLAERLKLMKGLTVAGTRPGSFTYLMLQEYALRADLTPQKDITIIGVGGTNSMLPALENGQIAVGCTGAPFVELAVQRGKGIAFTQNAAGKDPQFDDFLFELVYALPEYVKAHPETTRKFLRGLFASVNDIMEKPGASFLPALKAQNSGLSDEMILGMLDTMKDSYSRTGTVTKTAVEKAGKFLVDTGAVKKAATFEEVANNDFLPKK